MPYRTLLINDQTTAAEILQQIDSQLPIIGIVSPNGNIAADRVGQLYIDSTSSEAYFCSATDTTIIGTTWNLFSQLQASELSLGAAATKELGSTANTVAVGNHTHSLFELGAAASGDNVDINSLGAVTGVTAPSGDNSTLLATTAYVSGEGFIKITTQVVPTSTINAEHNFHYLLTNVSSTTITLPISPTEGDMVWVTSTNGLTDNFIARNGETIMGLNSSLILDIADQTVKLRYINSSWRLI